MPTPRPLTTAAVAILLGTVHGFAGTFAVSPWTGDADSGLTTTKNYTAKADFNGDGSRVINGVALSSTGQYTTSYHLFGTPDGFTGNANNLTGSSSLVASDFFYSGSTAGNATLTLGNLVPGQTYTTTWYNVGFGAAGARQINITPGDTGVAFLYDENQAGAGNGSLLSYTFVAQAPQITYKFDAVTDADSFHHYAMTNSGPTGTAGGFVVPTYVSQTGAAPFTPTFQPVNNDLLQTKLLSAVGSGGDFAQETSGGVPVLTNGQFTIANSQLATGANGSSILFTLDLAGAALGYDVSKIVGFGGWNDNGRDRQLFQVYYSLVGDAGFSLLGTADFNPAAPGSIPSAVQSTFNTALTRVDAIRIDFPGGQENGYAGYGEFDVVGVATVPEPGTAALLLLGVAGVSMRRRRS